MEALQSEAHDAPMLRVTRDIYLEPGDVRRDEPDNRIPDMEDGLPIVIVDIIADKTGLPGIRYARNVLPFGESNMRWVMQALRDEALEYARQVYKEKHDVECKIGNPQ